MTPAILRKENQQEWANRVDPGLVPDLITQLAGTPLSYTTGNSLFDALGIKGPVGKLVDELPIENIQLPSLARILGSGSSRKTN